MLVGLNKPNKRVKDSPLVRNLLNQKKIFKLPCKDCPFTATSVDNMKEHRKAQHLPVKSSKRPKLHTTTQLLTSSSAVATVLDDAEKKT